MIETRGPVISESVIVAHIEAVCSLYHRGLGSPDIWAEYLTARKKLVAMIAGGER